MRYRLILKEDTYYKTVYHLSDNPNLDGVVLKPSIPKLKFDDENGTIKRVCFSTTIDGCLQGLYPIYPDTSLDDPRYTSFKGEYLYVYEPVNSDFSCVDTDTLVKKRLVPDAEISKEVWITSPVKVKLVGTIYVYPYDSAKSFKFIWRGKQDKPAIGIKLKWKWVDRLKESYLREDIFSTVLYKFLDKNPELKEIVDTIPESDYKSDIMIGACDIFYKYANHLFVYRKKGKALGFIILVVDFMKDVNIIIAVRKDYWGKGISKKLIDHAIKWSKVNGYKRMEWKCHTNNKRSLNLALHSGFKPAWGRPTPYITTLYYDLNNDSKKLREELSDNFESALNIVRDTVLRYSKSTEIKETISKLKVNPKDTLYNVVSKSFSNKFEAIDIRKTIEYTYKKCEEQDIPKICTCIFILYVFTNILFNNRLLRVGNHDVIKHDIDNLVTKCLKNRPVFHFILETLILYTSWVVAPVEIYKAIIRKDFLVILLGVLIIIAVKKFKHYRISKLREDLGNTPKGYKDINKIMDYCNEWFENNPDKADKVIWKRYIQVRNWIRELKKYRSKFGPITFERKIDELKLNKEKTGKDGYITLDRAILIFFKRWKESNYNLEDLNRSIMYCLVELRSFRKKFKKQDFSCKM